MVTRNQIDCPDLFLLQDKFVVLKITNTLVAFLEKIMAGEISELNSGSTEGQKTLGTSLQTELLYRGIFNESPDGILIVDADGSFLEFNQTAHRQLGYSREEFAKLRISDIDPVESPEDIRTKIEIAMKSERSELDVKHRAKNGEIRDVHIINQRLTITGVSVLHTIWRDITEHKVTENKLRKSKANLKRAEQIAMLGNWEWDIVTNDLIWSDEVYRIYGLDQLKDKPTFDIVTRTVAPECRDQFIKAIENAVKHDAPFDGEYRMIALDGKVRYTHTSLEVRYDEASRPVSMFGIVQDITARKRAEEEREQFFKFFNTSNDLMAIAGLDGLFKTVNPTWTTVLGYTNEELLQKPFVEFIHPEDVMQTVTEIDRQVANGSSTEYFENRYRCKDGSYKWLEWKAAPPKDNLIYAVARDITERKQAEAALKETNAKLLALLQALPDSVFFKDTEGRYLMVNKAFEQNTGTKQEMVLGKTDADFMPADIAEGCRKSDEDIMKRGEPIYLEDTLVNHDGRKIYLESVKVRVNDSKGNPLGLVGISRDVTERKRAEEEFLKISRQKDLILNSAGEGIYGVDRGGNITFINPAAVQMVGWPIEELIGKPSHAVFHHSRVDGSPYDDDQCPYHKALRDGTIYHVKDEVFWRKNGTAFPIEYVSTPMRENNAVVGAVIVFRDITEGKKAEEKIRQSEQFIRKILDTVDEGFIVVNRVYQIMTANKAYCVQANLTYDEVIGKHCYEVSHRANQPCHEVGEECSVKQVFATGDPYSVLHKHVDREGHLLYVETKGFPIKDADGEVTSVIETVNNITEKHLLEDERLKSQKLESIGTLAGGIAHDFNNLLQGIFGYISMAKMTFDRKDKAIAMLEQAEIALHQSVNLTNQLLTFSKGGKPVKKLVDLRHAIENSTRFTLSGSRADFRIHIPENLWQVEADEGQVGQVIQNIVLNADQAEPMGGLVTVTATNLHKNDPALPSVLAKGNYIVISIKDSVSAFPSNTLIKYSIPILLPRKKAAVLGWQPPIQSSRTMAD